MNFNYQTNFYRASFPVQMPVNVKPAHFAASLTGTVQDVFTKNTTDPISFGSKHRRGNDTSRGQFLKNIIRTGNANITDPYSGAKIISNEQYHIYQNTICKSDNAKVKIDQLAAYEKYMRPVEKNIYHMFKTDISRNDKFGQGNQYYTFKQLLMANKPKALDKLKAQEHEVLDQIEDETDNMQFSNSKKVLEEVYKARKTIDEDQNGNHQFRRKVFIDSITNMRDAQKTNQHFENLVNIANKLPSSDTSLDAYIVKYADRSEREISERLLSSSLGTIEHIQPDSKGGRNEASNFILVSAGSNVERGNMPIKEYIQLHPDIPNHMQEYINDMGNEAKKGNLFGYEWYPYVLQPTLENNMGIHVNLQDYPITDKEAFRTLPQRLWYSYPEHESSYENPIFVDDKEHS